MARSGSPSPSKSPMAVAIGPSPGVKLSGSANAEASRLRVGNVALNGVGAYALNPLTVTTSGIKVVPGGTVTTREVELAAETAACTAPMRTVFSEGVGLKFRPVIV